MPNANANAHSDQYHVAGDDIDVDVEDEDEDVNTAAIDTTPAASAPALAAVSALQLAMDVARVVVWLPSSLTQSSTWKSSSTLTSNWDHHDIFSVTPYSSRTASDSKQLDAQREMMMPLIERDLSEAIMMHAQLELEWNQHKVQLVHQRRETRQARPHWLSQAHIQWQHVATVNDQPSSAYTKSFDDVRESMLLVHFLEALQSLLQSSIDLQDKVNILSIQLVEYNGRQGRFDIQYIADYIDSHLSDATLRKRLSDSAERIPSTATCSTKHHTRRQAGTRCTRASNGERSTTVH